MFDAPFAESEVVVWIMKRPSYSPSKPSITSFAFSSSIFSLKISSKSEIIGSAVKSLATSITV